MGESVNADRPGFSGENMIMKRPSRMFGTLIAAGCLVGAAAIAPTTAGAHPRHHQQDPVSVITTELNGPRQLSYGWGRFLVAESDAGQVTAVDPRTGRKRVLVDGLTLPQGVAARGGWLYIATGEAAPDSESPGGPGTSGLMVARPGGTARMFADLTTYELANNPDGQIQFGPDGQPLDALSNPYFVLRDRSRHGFLLVADAGANVVLRVDRHGTVSTFFVPPAITSGACATLPNNTTSGVGCDPVPTGLAYGPDGLLYISALTSEVPGEGRVYVVDHRGHLVRTITGFSSPTGVAVDDHGTVYVSELLQGAPEGEQPPPGFDPSTVGQIVKVPRHGPRSYGQVTMPSGLLWRHGSLYASAWAIASFVGISDAGQVVRVGSRTFNAAERP